MKKPLVILLSFVELILLIVIAEKLYQSFFAHKLKQTSVISMNKGAVNFVNRETLKYFYEPDPRFMGDLVANADFLSKPATYHINNDTLNERFDYPLSKPPGAYRILTIGDSYTYGLYVDTEDNYPETLEDMLNTSLQCPGVNTFEVINLGMYGYDIAYTVERFLLRGQKYQPDFIIWLVLDGNFLKSQEHINEKILHDTAGDLSSDDARKMIITELGEEKIVAIQKKALLSFLNIYTNPLLLYSPHGSLTGKAKNFIDEATIARPNTMVFSGTSDINEKKATAYPDGHPTKTGYEKIASELYGRLKTYLNCL